MVTRAGVPLGHPLSKTFMTLGLAMLIGLRAWQRAGPGRRLYGSPHQIARSGAISLRPAQPRRDPGGQVTRAGASCQTRPRRELKHYDAKTARLLRPRCSRL